MRSRYAAYALNLGRYIIDTTDSTHPDHSRPAREWITDIRSFSDKTLFKDLEILEKDLGKDIATVTFRAHLLQDGKDVSFTERSRFRKAGKRWVYCDGEFLH
jgi:SEC-C motif-containing protein